MIERLGKENNGAVKPSDKEGLIAEALAKELGVPAEKAPEWLDALYSALGQEDQMQRAVKYLALRIKMRNELQELR